MEIVNAMEGMDNSRRPGTAGRRTAVEPGDPAVGVQDIDPVLPENFGDFSYRPEAEPFSQQNRDIGDAFSPGFLGQRSLAPRGDKHLKPAPVQILCRKEKGGLASPEGGFVNHLQDSQFSHLFTQESLLVSNSRNPSRKSFFPSSLRADTARVKDVSFK
jgi:hypothetical protein